MKVADHFLIGPVLEFMKVNFFGFENFAFSCYDKNRIADFIDEFTFSFSLKKDNLPEILNSSSFVKEIKEKLSKELKKDLRFVDCSFGFDSDSINVNITCKS